MKPTSILLIGLFLIVSAPLTVVLMSLALKWAGVSDDTRHKVIVGIAKRPFSFIQAITAAVAAFTARKPPPDEDDPSDP
jgi:hypothetical protein